LEQVPQERIWLWGSNDVMPDNQCCIHLFDCKTVTVSNVNIRLTFAHKFFKARENRDRSRSENPSHSSDAMSSKITKGVWPST